MEQRISKITRETKETKITLSLNIDGARMIEVSTGIGFLDHLITSLAFHAGFDLSLKCEGDLKTDDHHSVEDCALALGIAIDESLGDRSKIKRFGFAYVPLDESLARAVVDLSGRPSAHIDLNLTPRLIGNLATENITHFLHSLAMTGKMALHVDVIKGVNDHHKAEAAFKAVAIALRESSQVSTFSSIPSTKGTLT